ncbi:SDR family NAD(P)-dependent oxidoreductase [Marinobacterium jannaschii]|uniref:SDR family NAD(P)-dependent oxidoreductase n=1 Tax=Marinobacterium jannaschii TaxID=64970 RepID=UPI00047FBD0B|nr:SDR family oxidoreductase [Marinobacterium jannaschii]
MFSVKDKRVLITGGASGIGLALVRHFQSAGATVAVIDLCSSEQLDATGAEVYLADVGDEAQLADAFGNAAADSPLDVVINNAGIALPEGRYEDADLSNLDKVLHVNVRGVYLGLKYAARYLRDGGAIINTASAAAHITFPEYSSYSVSKGGVLAMTRTAALQLGRRGIRVNAVSPGTVLTPMESSEGAEARISVQATALERPARVEDILGAYHFLAADESSYITGTEIRVDGGWIAGMTYNLMERALA